MSRVRIPPAAPFDRGTHIARSTGYASVIQGSECHPSKVNVVGSNPTTRSTRYYTIMGMFAFGFVVGAVISGVAVGVYLFIKLNDFRPFE